MVRGTDRKSGPHGLIADCLPSVWKHMEGRYDGTVHVPVSKHLSNVEYHMEKYRQQPAAAITSSTPAWVAVHLLPVAPKFHGSRAHVITPRLMYPPLRSSIQVIACVASLMLTLLHSHHSVRAISALTLAAHQTSTVVSIHGQMSEYAHHFLYLYGV